MKLNKEWSKSVIAAIADDPEPFYSHFFPSSSLESVGANLRLQPCPVCGHYDCCTITPGEVAVNCFSPGCISGNHLNFTFDVLGISKDLIVGISELLNIPYPENDIQTPEQIKKERLGHIKEVAMLFYHQRLLENSAAISYQTQIRKHSIDSIKAFKIGLTGDYLTLYNNLVNIGYSKEEIKEAKVWFPDDLLIYPYIDPFSKDITRFNTKNPFNSMLNGTVIKGFSAGNKSMMTTPRVNFDYVVLVEGENDLITLYENGCDSCIAIGGKLSDDQLKTLGGVLRRFKNIYCMFDNDDQGREYEEMVNNSFPSYNIHTVDYGDSPDPDDAYKIHGLTTSVPDLIKEHSSLLTTEEFSIYNRSNIWCIENRFEKLEFEVLGKNKNNVFTGTIRYYEHGMIKDMQYDKTLAGSKFKPLNFHLLAAIDNFFNSRIEDKSVDELVVIYPYTKWKREVIRRLAAFVYQTPENEREFIVGNLKRGLGEEITDIVLKEVNELQNEDIVDYASIPRMQLGQFFSVKNNEAFMYFTYIKRDNDTIRKLPYLVSNDRQLIRLDLYKRKDEQCLILIRNKYELPVEVPQAIMDLQRISLSQNMVEEFVNDEIDQRELDPKLLIRRIEMFIRRYFYAEDENIYKVLALWVYGTYCYELFGQYPYLFLNGPKGSGKTVLDVCLDLLAFNPKMTVSITNAALFRSISIEGGTLILDEMENLTSRNKTADSDLAAVLKGGYMRAGYAMRCDKDNGNLPQMFGVFGPKVISNIAGLEDIIGDRCIQINTMVTKHESIIHLEDPKHLYVDGLSGVRELTSKCALSVLEHFQTIYKIYKENVFKTRNARLAQILRPLQALAFLAGRDYEKAFLDFYNSNVKVIKEEIEYETPEGALDDILNDIAAEVMGIKEPNYIAHNFHKYRNPITINYEEGWFELDVIHIKTFMEEVIGGVNVDNRQINTFVRRVSPKDMYQRKRRTTVSLDDETLIKEYNGNTRQRVNVYKYYLSDFFPAEEVERAMKAQLEAEEGLTFKDF